MTAKNDALAIAHALANLEVEHDISMRNPLHKALLNGLHRNAAALGLSDDDVAEIAAVGPATPARSDAIQPREGGNKDKPS